MLKHVRILIFLVAIATAAVCVMAALQPNSSQTQTGKCDQLCLQAKVDRQLLLMGEFGKDDEFDRSMRDLMSYAGPQLVRVVEDTYQRWGKPDATMKGNARPAEMRWRAVHLLGSLNSPEAIPFLYDLAKQPLPDPRAGEFQYADAYRISLRSIDGLEKLKAADELKDLHERGGLLSNPTALSLYALGINVGGVSYVDARKALSEDVPDSKDYHAGKGRPPQPQKPGGERIKPVRRPDTPLIAKQRQGD